MPEAVREIFLSYASADRERVAPLVHALEEDGLQIWWDEDIGDGQIFHRAIEQALTRALCVVVVWSRESIRSEWVINEASDARGRDRLVPVLLDPVVPPLEFRHLQAADLREWRGDRDDPEFAGLRRSLAAMIGVHGAASSVAAPVRSVRHWWQAWPGRALGAAAVVIALLFVIFGIRQRALVRPVQQTTDSPAASVQSSPDREEVPAQAPAAASMDAVNLLDMRAGAQLVRVDPSHTQWAWANVFNGGATSTPVYLNSFAVLSLPGDRGTMFDTLAIYVDKWATMIGVKELEVSTSTESAGGPFVKAALITAPDYQNLATPFHEFRFPPVQARFVRFQIVSFHSGAAGNVGTVGSIQLYHRHAGGTR
jgi:TIR domain